MIAKLKAHKPDYILAIMVFVLIVFGLIMVSSASVVESYENTGDTYYYFKHQLLYGVVFGMVGLIIFSRINYNFWKKISFFLLILSIVLLIVVLFFGREIGGSRSWFYIGSFSVQPTELVKLFMVIYLASWLEKRQDKLKSFSEGFMPFLLLVVLIAVLIVLQPDLGTLSIILLVAVVLYFVAGASLAYMALLFGGSVLALFGLIKIFSHAASRFTAFLHPELDPQGIGYQINQALLAIGSGGILGLGLGASRQKYNYLPEATSDSIFAVVGEELGFIFSIILVILFVVVALRGFKIALNSPDLFSRLVATGITTWIIFQAFINIAGILNIIPLTGIPLPFISYGGSAMIVTLAGIGLLLNISRYTKENQEIKRIGR